MHLILCFAKIYNHPVVAGNYFTLFEGNTMYLHPVLKIMAPVEIGREPQTGFGSKIFRDGVNEHKLIFLSFNGTC